MAMTPNRASLCKWRGRKLFGSEDVGEHLARLHDHLGDVLVAEPTGGGDWITVEGEDVHAATIGRRAVESSPFSRRDASKRFGIGGRRIGPYRLYRYARLPTDLS